MEPGNPRGSRPRLHPECPGCDPTTYRGWMGKNRTWARDASQEQPDLMPRRLSEICSREAAAHPSPPAEHPHHPRPGARQSARKAARSCPGPCRRPPRGRSGQAKRLFQTRDFILVDPAHCFFSIARSTRIRHFSTEDAVSTCPSWLRMRDCRCVPDPLDRGRRQAARGRHRERTPVGRVRGRGLSVRASSSATRLSVTVREGRAAAPRAPSPTSGRPSCWCARSRPRPRTRPTGARSRWRPRAAGRRPRSSGSGTHRQSRILSQLGQVLTASSVEKRLIRVERAMEKKQ